MKSLLFVSLAWLACVQGANILAMFPFPAKSHHAVFQPIVLGLANRGHKVTYVTSIGISQPPANLEVIDLTNAMAKMKDHLHKESPEDSNILKKAFIWVAERWTNLIIRQAGAFITEEIIAQEQVFQELLKDTKKKYDLILLETTFAQESLAVLSHKYGAPIVEVMPATNLHWSYFLLGMPFDTSYIVDIESHYSDHMTFKERLINTAYSMLNRFANMYYFLPKAQEVADKYFRYPGWENRPPLLDIVQNTSLLLMNSHVALNYPYPLPPNVQLIGGINIKDKAKPLPKDIKQFMDGAKDGVIYFTLGSHIDVSETLGDKLKDEFLKAFGKIKQRVLWKWETDFPNTPANVMTSKWFPQQDILAHKNMKIFITHGGGLSTAEAIFHGIPMIGIPILGDQPKNVNHAKVSGYGLHLDFTNLTEASISWAINEVLTNPSYNEKVKERSAVYKDKTQTPLETAMYWIEYVLRHNGAHHLRPAITYLPWCQQALLDVYLALAAIVLIPTLLFYYSVKAICRCICSRKSAKGKNKKKKE